MIVEGKKKGEALHSSALGFWQQQYQATVDSRNTLGDSVASVRLKCPRPLKLHQVQVHILTH